MGRIMVFRMVVFVRKQVELGALHGIKLLSLIENAASPACDN